MSENRTFQQWAHLILLQKNPDSDLLEIVAENLRWMLGTDHPDVETLALRISNPNNPNNPKFIFNDPQMLKRSWAIVIEKTSNDPLDRPGGVLFGKNIDPFCKAPIIDTTSDYSFRIEFL